ncbi:dextranase-like [Haliotis rufescens]|uniref:dextranase-like n=1 Tax=Haliotis rufescens TaxID=6454 RepID=UPI00201EFAC5|nr:dextranase-like [Haliotis rufescens]
MEVCPVIYLVMTMMGGCMAELVIYPAPPTMESSDKYEVLVGLGDPLLGTFTYKTTSNHRHIENHYVHPNRSVSWSSFAFSRGPVIVEVRTQKDFSQCLVRPVSYKYACSRVGNKTARFTVTRNSTMMSVEFDNDYGSWKSDIVDKLLIFAEPLERDVPSKSDPSVMFFDVGVHYLDGQVRLNSSIKEVYISAGAFVDGGFITTDNTKVKFHGRGICSGRKYKFHDKRFQWSLINTAQGTNHTIEGITLSDPQQFFIFAQSPNNIIKQVKMVGAWPYNTDGIEMGVGGLVEDVFIMANDDSLKVYNNDMTIQRVVIWQMQNGAVFQTGWWTERDLHRVSISNIDVIHTDWCTFHDPDCGMLSRNNAVFDLAGNVKVINMYNVSFQNIRLEGFCPRFVFWTMPAGINGTSSNVRFIDVSVGSQPSSGQLMNEISGYKPNGYVSDWLFANLSVSGRCIATPNAGRFVIDNSTTSNIKFSC